MAFKFKYECEFCGKEKVMTEEQARTAICECETSIDLNNTWCKATEENYNALVKLGIEFVGELKDTHKYFVIQRCFSSYTKIKDKTWFEEINKQIHLVNGKFEFVEEKSKIDKIILHASNIKIPDNENNTICYSTKDEEIYFKGKKNHKYNILIEESASTDDESCGLNGTFFSSKYVDLSKKNPSSTNVYGEHSLPQWDETLKRNPDLVNNISSKSFSLSFDSKDLLKKNSIEKLIKSYNSGNYIAIFKCTSLNINWTISLAPDWEDERLEWKLIHKKDESILKAFLENNNITIKYSCDINSLNIRKVEKIVDNFINEYNEFYTYKLLPEIDKLKEKHNTGKYILVRNTLSNKEKFFIENKFYYQIGIKVILVHQKHKQILDAYMEDNKAEIEWHQIDDGINEFVKEENFLESYNEDIEYRLKSKQEYPIFKENEDGEILKFSSEYNYEIVFSYSIEYIGKKYTNGNSKLLNLLKDIPYNKERNLYHKQPIWGFDNTYACTRHLKFYNAIDNSTISDSGSRYGFKYDNYEALTVDQLKSIQFIWNMYKEIKD